MNELFDFSVHINTNKNDDPNSTLSHDGHIVLGDQIKLCFTTPSLTSMVSTAKLGVVKQSFSGLPGQYGRHVTRANVLPFLDRVVWSNEGPVL